MGGGGLLALGIIMIVLGIAAIAVPMVPGIAVTLLIGFILLISGVVHGVKAARSREGKSFFFELFSGIIYLLAGLVLLLRPEAGLLGLTLVVGMLVLMQGVAEILIAFQIKPAAGWGWMLTSGIVVTLLGVFVLAEWPVSAFWLIGTVIGVSLIFKGWTAILFSSEMRIR